jgi:hypothetical protein
VEAGFPKRIMLKQESMIPEKWKPVFRRIMLKQESMIRKSGNGFPAGQARSLCPEIMLKANPPDGEGGVIAAFPPTSAGVVQWSPMFLTVFAHLSSQSF